MEDNVPTLNRVEETATYGKFVVEPLERGYGVTLGNSLRRVLLSSIPGAAITRVRIEGVLHEFSTIPGLREDVTTLLLNIKEICVHVEPELAGRQHTLKLNKKGAGRVTGADIECPAGVTIVNPEVYIAEIAEDNASLEMTMVVAVGKGYVLPEESKTSDDAIGTIPVAAAFTPVRKVNYIVEPRRVGFKTDLEGLILEIYTNGTITPSAAISQASAILDSYYQRFMELAPAEALIATREPVAATTYDDMPISELNLGRRAINGLSRANIKTVGDLLRTSDRELLAIKNFGPKCLAQVHESLKSLGIDRQFEPIEAGEEEPESDQETEETEEE